ncbi:hypothetical protein GCM10027447_30410 [Glycomyces halotolerans]
MIAVHVFLQCRIEHRQEFIEALKALQDATRAGDEGCLHYSFAADLEDPTRFVCLEEWTDADSLKAHLEADHHRAASAVLDRLRQSPAEVRIFHAQQAEL